VQRSGTPIHRSTDKTTITTLQRVSWEAVAGIVAAVVADRLDELCRIGVDEVSYRRGYRYLTVVADHDRDGAVVPLHRLDRRSSISALSSRASRARGAGGSQILSLRRRQA
jgi:transposase